jgi:hypothetical protein
MGLLQGLMSLLFRFPQFLWTYMSCLMVAHWGTWEAARPRRKCPAMGHGCLGLTGMYGAPPIGRRASSIHRAAELGVTNFDTAEAYGPFTNEELVGH